MHLYWGLVILCLCLLSDKGFWSSDVPPETRARPPKCKNPIGEIGNTFRKGCFSVTCKKKGKKKAKWVERKVKNCCSLDGKTASSVKDQCAIQCGAKGKEIAEFICNCPSTTCPSTTCPSTKCPSTTCPTSTCPSTTCPTSTCPSTTCPTCPTSTCPATSTTDEFGTGLLYLGPGFPNVISSEIYSLDDNLSDVECFIPDYPEDITMGMVGFVLNGVLTNCGGDKGYLIRETSASCFSLINFNWTVSASMNVGRLRAAAVAVGDVIWVAGGSSWESGDFSSIEVYDGEKFTLSTIDMPYAAQGHCMTYIPGDGDRVLLVGGVHSNPVNSTYLYTPTTGWTQMASMSIPRVYHACTYHRGAVWVGGGMISPSWKVIYTDTVEVYTPSTKQWSGAVKLPVKDMVQFASDNINLYFAGGRDNKDIYKLDEDESGWTKIREMASRRDWFPALIISDTECYGVSYSDDQTIGLVLRSVFNNIFSNSRMINQIQVQCCKEGVLSTNVQTCGTALDCEMICGEKKSDDVTVALAEDAMQNKICKADSAVPGRKRRLFSTPIYRLWYCPSRVRTVATLSSYSICCLHPTVWRRPGVATKCCKDFKLCV